MNISLDTLDRDRFIQMTRRDELANVLDGIEAAKEAGFAPVKINAVVERGVNDGEIIDLARFGRERGVEVRFIEFMPLDASGHWLHDKVVGQDEIVAVLSAEFPLEPVPARGAAPADTWRYRDGAGIVGVIPTVTKPFCGDCDRVRLTADGKFRTCLFATDEFDLMSLLRNGATDQQLADEIVRAVGLKWSGHQIGQVTFETHRKRRPFGHHHDSSVVDTRLYQTTQIAQGPQRCRHERLFPRPLGPKIAHSGNELVERRLIAGIQSQVLREKSRFLESIVG